MIAILIVYSKNLKTVFFKQKIIIIIYIYLCTFPKLTTSSCKHRSFYYDILHNKFPVVPISNSLIANIFRIREIDKAAKEIIDVLL